MQEVKQDLFDICVCAFNLGFMFMSSKTEYVWVQGRDMEVDPGHVEILGSAGARALVQGHGSYKIVFGGVTKGGGLNGRLCDEIVHLSKSEVLLGPFSS